MLVLVSENKQVDQVTLLATNYVYSQQLGSPDYITKLEATGNVEHFESYEREFIDQYKQRETERVIKGWLSNDNKESQELISELQLLDDVGHSDDPDKNATLKQNQYLPFL